MYSEPKYPIFCHGALWTLSYKILHSLACAYDVTETGRFYLEDILITGNNLTNVFDMRVFDRKALFCF